MRKLVCLLIYLVLPPVLIAQTVAKECLDSANREKNSYLRLAYLTKAIEQDYKYTATYLDRGRAFIDIRDFGAARMDLKNWAEILIDANKGDKKALTTVQSQGDDHKPPTIIITQPTKDNSRAVKAIVGQNQVIIKGFATDESGLFELRINQKAVSTGVRGQFSETVTLNYGTNTIKIEAVDIYQNLATKELTVVLPGPSLPSLSGKYYALLFAVDTYEDKAINKLDYPISDAKKLRKLLFERYQFDERNIKLIENPTREKIFSELQILQDSITPNDNVLIFYAGHGSWSERIKEGYWIPSNGLLTNRAEWISNSDIIGQIRGLNSRHTLVVSDACFSGSLLNNRDLPEPDKSITNSYQLPSRRVITSGAKQKVPDKSVFMYYLVKHLEENTTLYLPSEQLFSYIKPTIIKNSPKGYDLVPQQGIIPNTGDLGGDFIFVRRNVDQPKLIVNSVGEKNDQSKVSTFLNRYALVIGNSEYLHSASLSGQPVNDAKSISQRLKELGFKVTTLTNATLVTMEARMNEFFKNINNADVASIFYVGHGIEAGGVNYLIPIDAKLARPEDVNQECLKLDEVIDRFEFSEAKIKLVFLDAGRTNPFRSWSQERGVELRPKEGSTIDTTRVRGFRPLQRSTIKVNIGGFGQIQNLSVNTKFFMSCQPGHSSSYSSKQNGFMTKGLLQHMHKGVELEDMWQKVIKTVYNDTFSIEQIQIPYSIGIMVETLVF